MTEPQHTASSQAPPCSQADKTTALGPQIESSQKTMPKTIPSPHAGIAFKAMRNRVNPQKHNLHDDKTCAGERMGRLCAQRDLCARYIAHPRPGTGSFTLPRTVGCDCTYLVQIDPAALAAEGGAA